MKRISKVAINPSCIPIGKLQDFAKELSKKYGWSGYYFENNAYEPIYVCNIKSKLKDNK